MQSHSQIEQSEQVELSATSAHSNRSSSIILPSGHTSVESKDDELTPAILVSGFKAISNTASTKVSEMRVSKIICPSEPIYVDGMLLENHPAYQSKDSRRS